MPNIGDPRTFLLILVVIGFALQQITVGHNLDQPTALSLLYAGLAAGGVSVAHTAGVAAASTTPPAPAPAPAPAPVAPIP